jgi:2-polyprenyl-3-methyl-5-hydroxy-6-metoxy-1,4-benzoquinol methylase
METQQQKESLEYFKEYAQDWKNKADNNKGDSINIIKQRNDYVLKVISQRESTKNFLDVGCGTGELVVNVAKKGINSVGVDFSNDMINIANKTKATQDIKNSEFVCDSIFNYKLEPESYDSIAANGFIEYISYEELDNFLTNISAGLSKGGSFVFGSRNRLFNIFSSNKFTEQEIKSGSTEKLLKEIIKIYSINEPKELVGFKTAELQEENTKHETTGVNVSTRYQFTPAQLVNMLDKKGLKIVEIFPVHIHGAIPAFRNKNPKVHGNIANLLQEYSGTEMIANSSSFMIHATKE